MQILTRNTQIVPTISDVIPAEDSRWKTELKAAFRDSQSLLAFLELDPEHFPDLVDPADSFPILVTRSFAERMEKRNPNDPLLRQVLQRAPEIDLGNKATSSRSGEENNGGTDPERSWKSDPVGDLNAQSVPGLLHKYSGRVLLIATGACAIHCRYCFRQHFDYGDSVLNGNLEKALDYIKADESIFEVILSGGDPLMLVDSSLKSLIDAIEAIPHVEHLRLHTRLPIVLPARISNGFIESLSNRRLQVRVVVHANHANELNVPVGDAVKLLQLADMEVLNQTVLLKGVNDSEDELFQLSKALMRHRIAPYYLHVLDQVIGAESYRVEAKKAVRLIEKIRKRLPGFAVPKLVQELAGEPSKTPVH